MLSIFQMAIFQRQFSAIFQSFFFWFKSFIFDKLAPPPPLINVSKYALNHFLSLGSIPVQKTVAKSYKRSIFLTVHFGLQANSLQGYSPPPRYATGPSLLSTAALPSAHKIISMKIYCQ